MTTRQSLFGGAAVFLIASLYVWWLAGDVLHIGGDEGIYLDGAQRVASGQQPYRDFLAITGPLTFWLEGAIGASTGLRLIFLRLPMVFDCAFLAWAVFWLTSRFAGLWYSAGTALAFLALDTHVRKLVINHRWDSAALAMGALVLAFLAASGRRRAQWFASGLLMGLAVCATPSMWLVTLALAVWCGRKQASALPAFLGGGALVAAAAAIYLLQQHTLGPMIESFRWTAANYTRPNRVVYGYVAIDPAATGRSGVAFPIGLLYAVLPAILPIAAVAGWGWRLRSKANPDDGAAIVPLLAVTGAFVGATWPHWSSDTLLYTAALPVVLCAILLYRSTSASLRLNVGRAILFVSVAILAMRALPPFGYMVRDTRRGTVRTDMDESEMLAGLEQSVQPGDSIFSFPYTPSLYYWLDAANPTRYAFLQPGMMNRQDEALAIEQLRAAPPKWIVFEKWTPEAVTAFWPRSDAALIPMAAINGYIDRNYQPADTVTGAWGSLSIRKQRAAPLR